MYNTNRVLRPRNENGFVKKSIKRKYKDINENEETNNSPNNKEFTNNKHTNESANNNQLKKQKLNNFEKYNEKSEDEEESEYEDEDTKINKRKGNYFSLDFDPLKNIIANYIVEKNKNLSLSKISKDIGTALNSANKILIKDYSEPIPSDKAWKVKLSKDEIKILEPKLKYLRENIKNNKVDIKRILESDLHEEDQTYALQLYDILRNEDPYTKEYLSQHTKLLYLLNSSNTKNTKPHTVHTHYEKYPNINKILNSNTTNSDKKIALEYYNIFKFQCIGSEEWTNSIKKINDLIYCNFSAEELEAFNKYEESLKTRNIVVNSLNILSNIKRKILELDIEDEKRDKIFLMYQNFSELKPSSSSYIKSKEKLVLAVNLPYRKKRLPEIFDINNTSITIDTSLNDEVPTSFGGISYPLKRVHLRDRISTLIEIPYNTPKSDQDVKNSIIKNYCCNLQEKFDKSIYGMYEAKEKIIQYINDKLHNPNGKGKFLALKGAAGVGKTLLSQTIAEVIGLPFGKISFGGLIDSSVIKGSSSVWEGSSSSTILKILSNFGCCDGVILLDEIDKLGKSEKGLQVQYSLLEVLDSTQNHQFKDEFLDEITHDLSNIMFIPTLNDETNIDPFLKDRLNIVEIPSYSWDEMTEIILSYTFPKALINKGIKKEELSITKDAIKSILCKLCDTVKISGMRIVEESVNDIVSKINLLRSFGENNDDIDVTKNELQQKKLSYHLEDFKGFPYKITSYTVDKLFKTRNKYNSASEIQRSMYS